MKLKNLLIFSIFACFVSGCGVSSSTQNSTENDLFGKILFENPVMNAFGNAMVGKSTSVSHAQNIVNLPKQIEFDGQIYTQGYNLYEHAKYYLGGENDGGYRPIYTGWTKMIRTFVTTHDNSIDKTIRKIKNDYENRKPKPIFTLTKIDETKLLEKAIFLPIKENKSYDNYFVTISVKERKCGVYVNVFYDMLFDGSFDEKEILKIMDERAEYFLQNYPKLECKTNG